MMIMAAIVETLILRFAVTQRLALRRDGLLELCQVAERVRQLGVSPARCNATDVRRGTGTRELFTRSKLHTGGTRKL